MNASESTVNREISQEDLQTCLRVLEQFNTDTNLLFELDREDRIAILKASGKLSRPDRDEFSRRKKDAKKAQKRKQAAKDRAARKVTGIRSAREASVFTAPKLLQAAELETLETPELQTARNCYVCKTEFTKLHHFYDTMCTSCGDFNYAKRFQTADLTGQVAIITGSRLKIGY
ncbi:MAG: oxidoreductase, partial [Bacteroidota bacterium]|nr:oxidoreductase [Bacteroidota bacterium]